MTNITDLKVSSSYVVTSGLIAFKQGRSSEFYLKGNYLPSCKEKQLGAL